MTTFDYSQIGQRVMERNPDAFKGLNVSAEEVGKRVVSRNPSAFQGIVVDSGAPKSPSAPSEADVASQQKYGATFGSRTSTGDTSLPKEALKTVGNIPSSAFGMIKSTVDLLNPVSTAGKIKDVAGAFSGLNKDLSAQKESQQGEADMANKIIAQYKTMKATGRDTSHIENYARGAGIDLSRVAIPRPTPNAAKAYLDELPRAGYETLVPEAARGLVTAGQGAFRGNQGQIDEGLQTAQRAITNDPVGQILPFLALAKGGATALDRTGVTKNAVRNFDAGVTTIAKPATYAFGKAADVVRGGGELAGKTGKFVAGQATGLQPDTISTVMNNPKSFSKEAMANFDRPALGQEVQSALSKRIAELSETGKAYKPIREMKGVDNSPHTIKVDPNYLEKTISKRTGVEFKTDPAEMHRYVANLEANVKGGKEIPRASKVKTSGSAAIRDAKDIRALQNLYDIWKPTFAKGKLTTTEFLNFRADLAKIAKFEREISKSADLENLSKLIREEFNRTHRKQVPGLEQLDESFSTQKKELKSLSKGLVDKDGNLTPQAVDRIANSGGKTAAKNALLARLEETVPGITEKIKVLKAIEDIEHASGIKVGTYGRAAGALVGFGAAGLPGLIIQAILTSPAVAVPILRRYGLIKEGVSNSTILNTVKQIAGTGKNAFGAVNRSPEKMPEILKKDVTKIKVPVGLSIENVGGKKAAFGRKSYPLDDSNGSLYNRGMIDEKTQRYFSDKVRDNVDYARKPSDFEDIGSYNIVPQEFLKDIEKLPVYSMGELGLSRLTDQFKQEMPIHFVLETSKGKLLVNTEGSPYVRYAAQIPESFTGRPIPKHEFYSNEGAIEKYGRGAAGKGSAVDFEITTETGYRPAPESLRNFVDDLLDEPRHIGRDPEVLAKRIVNEIKDDPEMSRWFDDKYTGNEFNLRQDLENYILNKEGAIEDARIAEGEQLQRSNFGR